MESFVRRVDSCYGPLDDDVRCVDLRQRKSEIPVEDVGEERNFCIHREEKVKYIVEEYDIFCVSPTENPSTNTVFILYRPIVHY